jgi:hypothetical protein
MGVPNPAREQLGACSGCAGDYEDPERTASRDGCDEEDASDDTAGHATQPAPHERFRAPEE